MKTVLNHLAVLPCGRTWAAWATASAIAAAISPAQAATETPPPAAKAPASKATVKDNFTLVSVGDLLGGWRTKLPQADPAFMKVVALTRKADAGFANLEGNMFDLAAFKGWPAAETGGFEQGGVGGGPSFIAAAGADLKSMGFSLISTANNHGLDWGIEGMFATQENLERAGIVFAGTGRNRAAAREAAYLPTTRGRVALVATATTFLPMAPAGPGSGVRAPRPGMSVIRNNPVTLVNEDEWRVLKGIAERQGTPPKADEKELSIQPNLATFTAQKFRLSSTPGLTYELNGEDRKDVIAAIKEAKGPADVAVFSIHAHETDSGAQELDTPGSTIGPADFLQPLFHDAVDAGADVVVTHGPHTLRGIEIYKGKVIFYGLGSFFLEVPFKLPDDWYDSVLASTRFDKGLVAEVRLHPLRLVIPGSNAPRSSIGQPELATGADARRILEALQAASKRYGTEIRIEGDVGYIRPNPN